MAPIPMLSFAKRDTCQDLNGIDYTCDGFGVGPRIGVGLGITVAILLVIAICCGVGWKKRRSQEPAPKITAIQLPEQPYDAGRVQEGGARDASYRKPAPSEDGSSNPAGPSSAPSSLYEQPAQPPPSYPKQPPSYSK
ncbi:hypothetical protein FA10DRAFT_304772 [Acaromyces ingoldii]|uniref:Uncharacterized protein n=1 Tax=Acaromyces ingoldii TaxID=215250 RepID=A0A316YCG9_9BASI|nr:hypothetical protein FA10DRAFT_304772 [Acaromyces ingoldii]PWN86901.1 hypothetical protein FA10DRAFT_304772 [Acaromyces ingoldii]